MLVCRGWDLKYFATVIQATDMVHTCLCPKTSRTNERPYLPDTLFAAHRKWDEIVLDPAYGQS